MSRKIIVLNSFVLMLAVSAMAIAGGEQSPKVIPLWEKGAPGFESRKDEKEIRVDKGKDIIINNVNNPSVTVYLPPKEKATGTAVIIAPGGGHNSLWIAHEGYNPAKWLSDHGIAAFVLKYRLAREKGSPYKIDIHAVQDGERAIRFVRSKAADWDIKADRIGIMGFSAGGELAAYLVAKGKKGDQGSADAADPVEKQSLAQFPGLDLFRAARHQRRQDHQGLSSDVHRLRRNRQTKRAAFRLLQIPQNRRRPR